MSVPIFAALLVAAFLHALWNALVRRDPDRDAAAIAMAAGGMVIGAVLLPFLPRMNAAAIPFVLVTSCVHVAYYALIARAYRHGELSVAYPIMRGLAPVIVTIAAAFFVEVPPAPVVFGIAVVAAGVVSLGLERLSGGWRGLAPAFANAFVIALYTLLDGLGARASDAPVTYVAWVLVGSGIATVAVRFALHGRITATELRERVGVGLAGGAMGYGAYAIALWAMTITSIGAVAAVRESSVLFAAAIGAIALHEKFGWQRWLSAALVAVGLALVKFGGNG